MTANEACELLLELGYPFQVPGNCVTFTTLMCNLTKSPIQVQSGYLKSGDNSWGHWWVRDGQKIIDPTKAQFQLKGAKYRRQILNTMSKAQAKNSSFCLWGTRTQIKKFKEALAGIRPDLAEKIIHITVRG